MALWCEVVPEWLTISSSGRLAAVRPQRATLRVSASSDGSAAENTASRNPDVQSSLLLPPPKRAVPNPPDSAPDKYVTPVTCVGATSTRARSVARGMVPTAEHSKSLTRSATEAAEFWTTSSRTRIVEKKFESVEK